jgi:hypothetical protein
MATAQPTVRPHSAPARLFGLDNDAPASALGDTHGMTDQPMPGHNAQPAAPRHVARCPGCGAVLAQEPVSFRPGGRPPVSPVSFRPGGRPPVPPGSAAEAIDNLYREVTRLREIAELKEASERADREHPLAPQERPTQRELVLQEEIRQLRATVARLRATSRVTST